MSSDDSGTTEIITDSLNNYEWLRWDVFADLTYAQTLASISTGGQYQGWQIAQNAEAQMFTNALLLGLNNSCTIIGDDSCNELLPNNLTGLLSVAHARAPLSGGALERTGGRRSRSNMQHLLLVRAAPAARGLQTAPMRVP